MVLNVTVSVVAVAAVTVPTALLFRTTVLLPGVVLNPKPWIVIVAALAANATVRVVTTGVTVATLTAEPLLTELVVTWAVKLPAAVGLVVNVTLSVVAVAEVIAPTAPLLKVIELFAALMSKPKPLIVMLEAFAAKLLELLVITGVTVATWTAAPLLLTPLVVTSAVSAPAVFGGVENETVKEVAVEAVTVPTASPLKSTVLLPGVVLKPKPLMVMVVALAAKLLVLLVITGTTVAT